MDTLLKNALEMDSTIKSHFHPYFTQNQNLVVGLQNYHSWSYLTAVDFYQTEDLLLNLLSNYLQRKIIFRPILKPLCLEQERKIFGENFKIEFNIFGHRIGPQSYYISAKVKA